MKTVNYIIFIALATLISSCDIELNDPFAEEEIGEKIYVIKEGSHESNRSIEFFKDNTLSFQAMFDESASYFTQNPNNQLDVNKLMGFADCGGLHHENSARFGWRWNNGQLEILAYWYIDGQRNSQLLGTAQLNKYYDYTLKRTENAYTFNFDGNNFSVERVGCEFNSDYMLFPYFGGDEKAPHDIFIKINRD